MNVSIYINGNRKIWMVTHLTGDSNSIWGGTGAGLVVKGGFNLTEMLSFLSFPSFVPPSLPVSFLPSFLPLQGEYGHILLLKNKVSPWEERRRQDLTLEDRGQQYIASDWLPVCRGLCSALHID